MLAGTTLNVDGVGTLDGSEPIVILGPNGSGKTKLAQQLERTHEVTAISAQRRTWLDDQLPVQDETVLWQHVTNQQNLWRDRAWHPTEEISQVLSVLIQEHNSALNTRNEEARAAGTLLEPLRDGRLIRLQDLWSRLFPRRKLDIGAFVPKVKRINDAGVVDATYTPRHMSDGERTVLYMAARVMTAPRQIIIIDEPELHMHSRLAVLFWNQAEALRPDCRFVYITHDLNFALSRRGAKVLVAKSGSEAVELSVDALPASAASEVLGAATLPFYARRVCFYEGEAGKGFASEFFAAWFDGDETYALASGDRNTVTAAVSGLRGVGVSGAEIIGLIDRDFYSDEVLANTTPGVIVLPVHEIESALCDRPVVAAVATHQGLDPAEVWAAFHAGIRSAFSGRVLSNVVAKRFRARVGDLFDGAFAGSQVADSIDETRDRHVEGFQDLDLPDRVHALFAEERERVEAAISAGGHGMLAILPGKHLLSLLPGHLGLGGTADLIGLVRRALDRRQPDRPAPLEVLGEALETALLVHLPPRRLD